MSRLEVAGCEQGSGFDSRAPLRVGDAGEQFGHPGLELIERLIAEHHQSHLVGGVILGEELEEIGAHVARERVQAADVESGARMLLIQGDLADHETTPAVVLELK